MMDDLNCSGFLSWVGTVSCPSFFLIQSADDRYVTACECLTHALWWAETCWNLQPGWLPSGKLTKLLKMTIEIVGLPIQHGDFP